jgi:hypothetical protein
MPTRLAVRRLSQGMNHARSLVRQVCGIAGQMTLVDEVLERSHAAVIIFVPPLGLFIF